MREWTRWLGVVTGVMVGGCGAAPSVEGHEEPPTAEVELGLALPAARPNQVFVTSGTYTGNLHGLAGGDAICAARAQAAQLPGRFVALLSTSQVDGMDRLHASRGWVQTNGLPFADTVDELFSPAEHLFYPAGADEFGQALPVHEPIMTGTDASGAVDQDGQPCGNWRQTTAAWFGGYTGYGGIGYTDYVGMGCSTPAHLICFELGHRAKVSVPPPEVARLVFISSASVPATGGIASADGVCSAEASSAGLPGSYRALLATSTGSALSRFARGDTPWYRPDNVKVAGSTDDFASGQLTASVSIAADGVQEFSNYAVWTGAATPDQVGTGTCADWTSADVAAVAATGISFATDAAFFADPINTIPCDFPAAHVYCLEE